MPRPDTCSKLPACTSTPARAPGAWESQKRSTAAAMGCCGATASAAPSAAHSTAACSSFAWPNICTRTEPGRRCVRPASTPAYSAQEESPLDQTAAAMTSGRPPVIVPVLSRTIAVLRPCSLPRSSTTASRIKQWKRVLATPTATEIAVGVAKPMAHGQANIITDSPNCKAMQTFSAGCGGADGTLPEKSSTNQTTTVTTVSTNTVGTNHAARLSARRCAAGLPP
mmetsp:Transcript_51010/g.148522  ORF Transcript_51010/g.148522 Transcript_51010/m.148522 type:complete len:225 (-) Transcript_51010:194-868(-)